MQAAKEKASNLVSSAKENLVTHKAKAEEKLDKGTATTKGEKEMAKETKKAKEAEAKMNLHEERATNKAQREAATHTGHAARLGHRAAHPTDGREALYASHEQHGGHLDPGSHVAGDHVPATNAPHGSHVAGGHVPGTTATPGSHGAGAHVL